MKPFVTSARSFLDQIPGKDRAAVRFLEARGYSVLIQWTSQGWRYQVKFPEK